MANRVANPPSRTAGVAAEAYRALALGDGRVRLAWAGANTPGQSPTSSQSAAISRAAEHDAAEIRRQASAQSAAIREAAEREVAELLVAKPAGQFTNQPASIPWTRPGTATVGRQARAMHRVAVIMVALVMSGVISGAAEIALHGLPFFFFRNAGAGAGNSQNLNENQGPGQPDAPGAHHPSPTSRPSRQATRQPVSG